MDKRFKVKYNRLENYSFSKKGYVDLTNKKIKNMNDYIELCNMFKDPRYETFRIFYMKNDKILAHESFTSILPNTVILCTNETSAKWFEKINNRIKRLNADGYYLAHNHPTNYSEPSTDDFILTEEFIKKVDGFKGHIIMGCENNYSLILKDRKGNLNTTSTSYLNLIDYKDFLKEVKEKTIYDIKIKNIDTLIFVAKHLLDDKESSPTIFLDSKFNIRMVVDIPNEMFNQKEENLNGFFKNIARTCGATKIITATQDKNTYKEIIRHVDYGTIFNIAYFDGENYVADEYMSFKNLFDKEIREKSRKKER